MTCPFCSSEDVEIVSPWGGQIITCQMRCRACNTYFEAIRREFDSFPGPDADSFPGPDADSFPWPDADGPEPNSRKGIRLDPAGPR